MNNIGAGTNVVPPVIPGAVVEIADVQRNINRQLTECLADLLSYRDALYGPMPVPGVEQSKALPIGGAYGEIRGLQTTATDLVIQLATVLHNLG